ncbi:hypothetical protein [Pseudomonas sp. N040]|uniref:hypothetical protein n=1 Tax=Pseudomonas sp. N040 TaxID=2785325 RepID=UPI0018A24D5A|nr:hypothetical protein [Pseudomonas sp. N040]MBF7730711.1 hypothetical protein [Pseudomonas sp. N040]MBW7014354.1 hypothetical protein [Pseudomonas sp. N040]
MQYDGMAWAIGLLALLTLLIAARVLLNRAWFLGWLRGTCGLLVLGVAGVIGMLALDLGSYTVVPESKLLATISFTADAPQQYRVTLLQGAEERTVRLDGDLWQLDARLFQWKGLGALIGLQPGYRLEKLTGRYLGMEQQQQSLNSRVVLARSRYGIDLWSWLRMGGTRDFYLFDPQARRVNYLPMANGAAYSVSLAPTGLLVKPLNSAAEQAFKSWQ